MFFEWGRDVSGYAPNSMSGTASGLNYSQPHVCLTLYFVRSQNLTTTPTNQTELNVSWSAPEDVFGGSETVVTYEVTLTQNGVDFTHHNDRSHSEFCRPVVGQFVYGNGSAKDSVR